MSRTVWTWIVVSAVLFVVWFAFVGGATGGDFAFNLLFGWGTYLGTVLPKVQIRWDGVAMAVLALVLFVAIAHYLGRWLYRELQPSAEANVQSTPHIWRLRWTLSLTGVVVLLFVSGISLVGVTHQSVWLANSPEPIFNHVLPERGGENVYRRKMFGVAFSNYSSTISDGEDLAGDSRDKAGERLHSWETRILPFLNYLVELDMERPWDDPVNTPHFRKLVPHLLNPELREFNFRDKGGLGLSHYSANSRLLEEHDLRRLDTVTDGTSNTILLGEVNTNFMPWGQPGNFRDPVLGVNKSPQGFGGPKRSRTTHFVMADGSVLRVNNDIDPKLLRQLSTPDGGEKTNLDD